MVMARLPPSAAMATVYTFVGPITGFSTGWTHIAGSSGGGVLFYNASTGEGAIATIDGAGNYSFTRALHGFSPWTIITAGGRP